ncbi:MAG TPA: MFS transporter [Tepidisphaeraceae bacterium]|nr:MFS transporter [Tepidisphaeraceae bacterium]
MTIGQNSSPAIHLNNDPARRRRLMLYAVEAVTGLASTMLIISIFFYTEKRFAWSMRQNLILAAVQGLVYIAGSLLANPLSRRFGRRNSLLVLFAIIGAIAAIGIFRPTPKIVTALLVIYTMVIALTWPMLESLVATGLSARELSRILGAYNLVWAGIGACAVAINGTIIEHWPKGVFIIPTIAHALGLLLLWLTPPGPAPGATPYPDQDLKAEDALLQQRRLALWLSRIALPATYIVIFSLSAMLPSLAAIKRLPTSYATLIGSAWLVARWFTFWFLGATHWWHTRPRLLLWAAVLMLLGFMGTVLPATRPGPLATILTAMIVSQIVLGMALGLIYSASLYFGMVLSDGSTEHGGYHEALIGLGQTMGPLAGAIAQSIWPGSAIAGIVAVSSLVALAIVGAGVAAIKMRQAG